MPTSMEASIDFSTPLRCGRNDNVNHEEHKEHEDKIVDSRLYKTGIIPLL